MEGAAGRSARGRARRDHQLTGGPIRRGGPAGTHRVAVTSLPAAPGQASASLNVYWLLGIGAGSPHRQVAYDFLRYCARADSDKLLTLEGAIGCRKSTWHDADVNRVIPFYRELEKIHAHARELPRLAHWSALATVIDRLVTDAVNTDTPLPALLARAEDEAAAITP